MAYMSQEHKIKIAAELKKVMPKDWKYSLGVRHHSTIVLNIAAAPVDIIAHMNENSRKNHPASLEHVPAQQFNGYAQVNQYHLEHTFSGRLLETFKKIKQALNLDNWDKSEIQTDYFNVGHYVNINIGKWNKPFQVTGSKPELSYEELKARVAQLEAENAQ